MRREELRDERGGRVALALHAGPDALERSALETSAAWPDMFRISLRGAPLLWARTWRDHYGWTWVPAAPLAPPVLAPMRADEARAISSRAPFGTDEWWSTWSFRLADELGVIAVSRRTPVVWLIALANRHRRLPVPALGKELLPFEPGEALWDHSAVTIPLRAWPAPDDTRVKAYRKLVRERALPPIVIAWSSALQGHLVLDGHARLVAAREEGVAPPVLAMARMVARGRRDTSEQRARLVSARATLEALAMRDDASANLAAIEAARIAARLAEGPPVEWEAVDRASAITRATWRREVRRALGARRDALTRDILRP